MTAFVPSSVLDGSSEAVPNSASGRGDTGSCMKPACVLAVTGGAKNKTTVDDLFMTSLRSAVSV